MLLKKETEYALIGLLALNEGGDVKDVKKIAAENGLSFFLLAKMFQRLAKANIIESKTGPGGGFRLVKTAEALTLKEITDALQGRERLIKCYLGKAAYCKENCNLLPIFNKIEGEMNDILKNYTLNNFIGEGNNDYQNR